MKKLNLLLGELRTLTHTEDADLPDDLARLLLPPQAALLDNPIVADVVSRLIGDSPDVRHWLFNGPGKYPMMCRYCNDEQIPRNPDPWRGGVLLDTSDPEMCLLHMGQELTDWFDLDQELMCEWEDPESYYDMDAAIAKGS